MSIRIRIGHPPPEVTTLAQWIAWRKDQDERIRAELHAEVDRICNERGLPDEYRPEIRAEVDRLFDEMLPPPDTLQ